MLSDYHCDDIPPTAPTNIRTLSQRLAEEIAHLRRELDLSNRSRRTMQTTIDILQEQAVDKDREIAALRGVAWLSTVKPVDMRAA